MRWPRRTCRSGAWAGPTRSPGWSRSCSATERATSPARRSTSPAAWGGSSDGSQAARRGTAGGGAGARQAVGQRRAEAHRPGGRAEVDDRGTRPRPAPGADPPGLLLRHAGPGARQAGHRAAGSAHPEQGRRLGREVAARCARRAAARVPALAELHGRGRRAAGRFRLLGNDEAHARAAGGAVGRDREPPAQEAVLEGAEGRLRRARERGVARRRLDPRADLRAEAAVRAAGAQAAARRRGVDLSRWLARARAVDEVRSARAVSGRRRIACVPDRARHRPRRRAGDEDAQGAALLRQAAAGGVTGLRWEWRTEADVDAPAGEVEESDEIYFLSDSGASVKVRGGRLDVKVLDRVEDGLQLWRPVVKAELPLDEDAAAVAAGALGVPERATTLAEL